jgi:hypothetical protein
MTLDISAFVHRCPLCQRVKAKLPAKVGLLSMPICSSPNKRLHINLYGPLKTSAAGNHYIKAMTNQHPHMDWEDLLPSMMLSYNCHAHRATGDSPFFLTFAHDPRLPYFDIEKPRMFYDSSYLSDMYKISRAAHKMAKDNFEEQRDRQEDYYDKKSKYRTFTSGDQVIIYYPNLPPGISPKFHIFWETFTVIEMVGRVNVKASQHNKKPIVVYIDRVLKFDVSGSKKEATENIHCIGIDLKAEREWARLDRERALGQQEEEEEEEAEVQWHIHRRTAGATGTLAPSSTSGTRQTLLQPRTQTPLPPSLLPAESNRQLLSTPPPSEEIFHLSRTIPGSTRHLIWLP